MENSLEKIQTSGKYILDGREVVPCDDLYTWARWYEKADRHIGDTTIDNVRVSTVFLGMDHSWGAGTPLLFETMLFGVDGELDTDIQDRYSTYEEAEKGHEKMVELVKKAVRERKDQLT